MSLFIETDLGGENINVLMDTGLSPDIIWHNTDVMNVDFRKTHVILLSYGHNDHIGGLRKVLKRIDKPTAALAHPKSFDPKVAFKSHIKFSGFTFIPQRSRLSVVYCFWLTIPLH